MGLNIVLIEPEIPNNTGNIGRVALATGAHLHLVKPFGFELDDKRLKRAGLDYWKHLSLTIYEDQESFFEQHKNKQMAFFSSHAKKLFWEIDYMNEQFLVFGKESVGLSETILEQNSERLYKIPLYSEHIRSLNLANAVAIATYEGMSHI
jgi:tRNA (cytidine/uridine-2'-O-)-methyltransferase